MHNIFKTSLLVLSWVLAKLLFLPSRPQVLMYHSFDTTDWKYGVSPSDLERQLRYIKKHRSFVSLDDVVLYHTGEKNIDSRAVAITIDDGYADTYSVFFPLAKELQIPFTLFLTTDLGTADHFGNLERPTSAMIQEMLDSGLMTLALHGHTHKHFDTVFEQGLVHEEIVVSEEYLQAEFGVTPEFVAYPSGRYNDAVLEYFKSATHYKAGFSIKSGSVTSKDDLYLMRRVEVSRNIPNFLSFALRLTRALELYNAIIKKLKK